MFSEMFYTLQSPKMMRTNNKEKRFTIFIFHFISFATCWINAPVKLQHKTEIVTSVHLVIIVRFIQYNKAKFRPQRHFPSLPLTDTRRRSPLILKPFSTTFVTLAGPSSKSIRKATLNSQPKTSLTFCTIHDRNCVDSQFIRTCTLVITIKLVPFLIRIL
jgi:hypothetical protein